MKGKYTLLAIFLIIPNMVFAQLVSIKGRVVDSNTYQTLSKVTVKIDKYITVTDKNGEFDLKVNLNVVMQKGINFSCVGYLGTHLIYEPNHIYDVGLKEKNIELKEVFIGAGDDIIKKAIKRIPENYPNTPTAVRGILRTETWRNQSEYFKSDAFIMAHIPPYESNEKTTVSVLYNKIDSLPDKSLKPMRNLSNYNVIDFQDIAHNNYIIKRISKKNKFDYLYSGKQVYEGHKVFVVNTVLKDTSSVNDRVEATFYIDTISYAFVAANINTYNLVRKGLLTVRKLNYQVNYEKIRKKWYLKTTHTSALFDFDKQSPQTTIDFIRTEIDSIDAQPIPYKDAVQVRDNILLVDKPGDENQMLKLDSLFKKAGSDGKIGIIAKDMLDTIRKNNSIANATKSVHFKNRIFNYFSNDNIRTMITLNKFPFSVNGQLNSISTAVNYGYGFGANFRLYKHLFFCFQINRNFWNNNHINISTAAFNLSNEFILNKNFRDITVTPYVGFEVWNLKYLNLRNRFGTSNYGLRISCELTHKKALFVSSSFNSHFDIANLNGLIITPNHYALGVGITFLR